MLSAFAVKRWQFTLVVFFALIALGVQALFTIPKTEDPTFPFARFAVVAVLPGATPVDMERLVAHPLETKLETLENVKTLKTEIDEGLCVVDIEFRAGSDPDRKRDEVLREISAIRPTLPSELLRLDVSQFNAARVNIVEVALVSELPYRELDTLSRSLKRRLEGVGGVNEVEIAGLPKQEVSVQLDLDRMVALGVSPGELLSAVGARSKNIPAGSIDTKGQRFDVKTTGDYASIDEVRATIVRSARGSAIRVADVADVQLGDAESAPFARYGGKRAVLVAANMRDNQNVFEVKKAIDVEIAAFAKTLPSGVRLERGFDQSANVDHRLGGFTRDFGIAILLVLVTLLPLGWRASLVVMVSIPLSLAVGLFFLRGAGFSINQLSIVGFVLALGLLVDDSVVVVENITRHLREGAKPRDAAIAATKQITVSVIGCTATLLFAFVPLLALPGVSGQFIRSMPVAVVFTIGASLVVSLTIVPFLASRLLKPEDEHGNVFFRLLTRVIEATYAPVLARALARPKTALLVALALFAGSLALVPRIGFSLFPKAGTPQFLVKIEAAEGAGLAESDRAARFVERTLARHPEVRNVAVTVGKGHPRIYYNVVPRNEHANVADVFAELEPRTAHDATARTRVLDSIRAELADFAGARIDLFEFENGPPVDAPIAIRLLGEDQAELEAAAIAVEKVLQTTEGTRDVRNPGKERRTDVRIKVDRDKAAILGVALPDVDRAVRLALGGVVAGEYRDARSDEPNDIRVTLARNARGATPDFATLDRIYVASSRSDHGAAPIPLGHIAAIELEPSSTKVRHYAKQRSITVTAQVRDGYNTDRVTKQVLASLASVPEGKGVRRVAAGELENRQESFGGLGAAIAIAIFGVLAVLVLEFRTFKSTLIVASVIPLGIVGGLVALFLSGYTLSFTANVGFVALMGIEVKNSILLVDFTNQLREEGTPLDDAIRRAGEARFVPILLTTLTAIGGLVPLVLERSSLYSPLALVILGGLVSSTLLARVVTPVLYKLVAPEIEAKESAPIARVAQPAT